MRDRLKASKKTFFIICLAISTGTAPGPSLGAVANTQTAETLFPSCLAFRPRPSLHPPIDWQDVQTFSRSAHSVWYKYLITRNPITNQLRKKHGDGSGLTFVIQPYDPDIESGANVPKNGFAIQAVFLKHFMMELFPEAQVRQFVRGEILNDGKTDRIEVMVKVGDRAEMGNTVDWREAGKGRGEKIIEMSLLKVANPGPLIISKKMLRTLLNIRTDARVLSLYASVFTRPGLIQTAIKSALKLGIFDTIIVSSRFPERISDSLKSQSNIHLLSSTQVQPTAAGVTAVIINDSRGKLPEIHGASDLVLVLGSPNIAEPINVGSPTIAFRKAEGDFNQSVWSQQTELIEATGGGFVADTTADAMKVAGDLRLTAPNKRTYEVINSDGTTAIDRILTNILNLLSAD